MSEISAILEWEKLGLKWTYIYSPKLASFQIPAKGQVQLPREGFTFSYPEGVLVYGAALFDHPACGARLECEPALDTKDFVTVQNQWLIGLTEQEWGSMFIRIPPQTPPGLYGLLVHSNKIWIDSMKLYLINVDSTPHWCLGFAYMLAVLEEPGRGKK